MDLAVISIESDLSTELSLDQVKGGFRGGVCVVATPPKHLNFEKLTHNPHSEEHFSHMAVIAMHYQERIPVEDILKAFI